MNATDPTISARLMPYLPKPVRWCFKPEVQNVAEFVCSYALPRLAGIYVTYHWVSCPIPAMIGFVSGIALRVALSPVSDRLYKAMMDIVDRWKKQVPSSRAIVSLSIAVATVLQFVPYYHATFAATTAACAGVLTCSLGAQLVEMALN